MAETPPGTKGIKKGSPIVFSPSKRSHTDFISVDDDPDVNEPRPKRSKIRSDGRKSEEGGDRVHDEANVDGGSDSSDDGQEEEEEGVSEDDEDHDDDDNDDDDDDDDGDDDNNDDDEEEEQVCVECDEYPCIFTVSRTSGAIHGTLTNIGRCVW